MNPRTFEIGAEVSEWQNMASAPRNGKRILIQSDEGDVLSLVWDTYWPNSKSPQGTEQFGWVMWPGQIGVDLSESEALLWMPTPPTALR